MARIYLHFLLILAISNQALSIDFTGVGFDDIKKIYDFINALYGTGMKLAQSPSSSPKEITVQLGEIISDLKTISRQLTNMESHQDQKLDNTVKVLLNNIEISGDLRTVRTELLEHIRDIDYWFSKAMQYDMSGAYNNKTINDFIKSVLRGRHNLEHTLFDIYKLIYPGPYSYLRQTFQDLFLTDTLLNYNRLCDKGLSQQQRMYYIFMNIIQIHLKAFTIITQAYSMQFVFDHQDYSREYKIFKTVFYNKLTNCIDIFIKAMSVFPSDIRQCDVQNPVIGQNVLELEGLFQVIVRTEVTINRKVQSYFNSASITCGEITSDVHSNFAIDKCQSSGWIQGCPVINSHGAVRLSWWKTADETYGHPYLCPNKLYELSGNVVTVYYNEVCVCSVNFTNQPEVIRRWDYLNMNFTIPKIMKISTEPQLSDIANNMVVTGVQFILHDNAIHLQIKQSKISKSGVFAADGEWKQVDLDHDKKPIQIKYKNFFDKRNILYLDDVGTDPKYVVTGVKFEVTKDGKGFELHVHSTRYDYSIGLIPAGQKWFVPGEHPINEMDYQRGRVEINLDDPDVPTMASEYHPDPQANKLIQFQVSSIKKDAGYHTVPFFDAQPVQISPEFPLGGIGLFYKERDGYGGYIAPRLFSYNISSILESSFNKWKQLEELYDKCNTNVTVNASNVKDTKPCKTLKRVVMRQLNTRNITKIKQIDDNNDDSSNNVETTLLTPGQDLKSAKYPMIDDQLKIHKSKAPSVIRL